MEQGQKQQISYKKAHELDYPKAILLDWDNTLADSWGIIHKCLNNAFVELGHEPWTMEDVRNNKANIHHSLRTSFPRLFGDKWELARDVYYNSFIACHLEEIKLLPGAEKTIRKLAEHDDIHIAIVSNKTGKYLRKEVEHLGLSDCFDEVIGATDAEKDKPDKEPLIKALEKTDITQENFGSHVWMVGDSKTDIEAAFNTGCVPVLYDTLADLSEYHGRGDIYSINCHNEFFDIASSLKGKKAA